MDVRILLTLLIIILLCVIIIIIRYNIESRKHLKNRISFKESMDLVDLPIITFYSNDTKINFLLDTGSDSSYINKSMLENLKYTKTNKKNYVIGIEGNSVESFTCNIDILYKDKIFTEEFSICDLDRAFTTVKQETGVQIHGILGSKFFKKYRYIIDFNELMAYTKK